MSVAEKLVAKLEAVARIDDPFTGAASPSEVKARSRGWPTAAEWAQVRFVKATEGEGRRIEEYRYVAAVGGEEQPVAIVFAEDRGEPVARLYARHQWVENRAGILPVDPSVTYGNDLMTRYFHALGTADLEAAVSLWEPDGYFQHSNGETFLGSDRLREDFSKFFKVGPIKLKYCNRIDTGTTCAYECYMPSGRPAIAIYDRSPNGLLAAARMYL